MTRTDLPLYALPCFIILSLALAVAGAATGHGALPKEAPRVVDYSISVRLDAEKKEIRGRQRVVWRNPSSDDVLDLWFHLYLNAFRDNRSTDTRGSSAANARITAQVASRLPSSTYRMRPWTPSSASSAAMTRGCSSGNDCASL